MILLGVRIENWLSNLFFLSESSLINSKAVFIGPRVFDQYSIVNLRKRGFKGSDLVLGNNIIKQSPDYISQIFTFKTQGKKVTGLANIPKGFGPFPLIIMVRGYVDREKFISGMGTQKAAEAFAMKGYLTIAPDFLGYGGSEKPSVEPLEERFQTYTTLLDLYDLVSNEERGYCGRLKIDCGKTYLWSHSNGGQISLTFLEITRMNIPTVLWAPVSKPFPYSILYYTDEFDDHGKALRKVVADFEKSYHADKYSLVSYLDSLSATILLQQGNSDDEVPRTWSDELYQKLKDLGKDIEYFVYQGADHNLSGSWEEAVKKDLEFFSNN